MRVPDFTMSCSVRGHAEDTLTHEVLECPLVLDVWKGSGIDDNLWTPRFRTLADCITNASCTLDEDVFGDFLAVMWDCWNARNRFIFSIPNSNVATLGRRALDFVRSYRLHHETSSLPHDVAHPFTWTPPPPGLWESDVPENLLSRATDDMYLCLNDTLI
ncbi:hypothetical protein Cgig2_012439 [Carnegiea gigantea]|uniref:Uncharacterized protein n=1 Tax=Carnegiea gigantea TaxID=171969 RepID=A0A9Q1KMN6_9CARY|nr:hypothetical protein Cgig2_012439 [Carnegiea gigantea]